VRRFGSRPGDDRPTAAIPSPCERCTTASLDLYSQTARGERKLSRVIALLCVIPSTAYVNAASLRQRSNWPRDGERRVRPPIKPVLQDKEVNHVALNRKGWRRPGKGTSRIDGDNRDCAAFVSWHRVDCQFDTSWIGMSDRKRTGTNKYAELRESLQPILRQPPKFHFVDWNQSGGAQRCANPSTRKFSRLRLRRSRCRIFLLAVSIRAAPRRTEVITWIPKGARNLVGPACRKSPARTRANRVASPTWVVSHSATYGASPAAGWLAEVSLMSRRGCCRFRQLGPRPSIP